MTSGERDFLKSLAHHLKPAVYIGRQGVTDTLVAAVDESLLAHELIKIKFNNCKDLKQELSEEICRRVSCGRVSLVGNVLTVYRQHPEEAHRRVQLPKRT